MATRKKIEILLVEDNDADVRLIQEALKESRFQPNLNVASDGVEALEFLTGKGHFENAPRPDFIILDLNMPRMDGREVLAELSKDPNLKQIPVVVLTTSGDAEDIQKIYSLCGNCYVRKPLDIGGLFDVIKAIEEFWFRTVTLPSHA